MCNAPSNEPFFSKIKTTQINNAAHLLDQGFSNYGS